MTAADGAADWIVLKFGGTSVSRRERWDAIGRLMAQRATEEGARVLVVVSALSGVTNELQAIVDRRDDLAAVQAGVEALVARHLAFAGRTRPGPGGTRRPPRGVAHAGDRLPPRRR
jgi:diaminopimelate decarboxylase/aspartate kinase